MADPWYSGPWQQIRPQIYTRDNGICQLCHQPVNPNNYHIDHIRPVARGGEWWEPTNLRLTHPDCNLKRPHPHNRTHPKSSRIW